MPPHEPMFYSLKMPAPKGCWTSLTAKYPKIDVFINSFTWHGFSHYNAHVSVRGEGFKDFLKEVFLHKSVKHMTIIKKLKDSAAFYVRAKRIVPLPAFYISGVIIEMPVKIKKGIVSGTIIADSKTKKTFLKLMDIMGYDIELLRAQEQRNTIILPKKYKEVLKEALRMGYYSIPRKATQKDLAKKLGMSKSNISKILMEIESIIMYDYLDRV